MDPQGLHVAMGIEGHVVSQDLQQDGTLGASNVAIPVTGSPNSMTFDSLAQFLYVSILPIGGTTQSVHFYSATLLQELPSSPLPGSFPSTGSWIPDPSAPLMYANNVYQVDPQTGLLNAILSPDPLPTPIFGLTFFSRPPGSQPIVGPAALLNSMSFNFGSLSVGQTTNPQTLTILSNGGQTLALSSFTLTGANAGDFAITSNTCPAALSPGQSCFVLISFTPSAAGARAAALVIADNASPPTETVQLSGTGLAPAPAVSLTPASLDFGSIAQGTGTSLSISVKNSGNAILHISNVSLGGADANDFSSSSPTCSAAIPTNSTCTISVTFTPLAQGLRSATITLSDDAPDTPQIISIKGNATAPASSAVTVNPASPDFGTTTQGTSTPLNVTVSNTGMAALHIASAVLGGSNATEFSFSDPTCSTAVPAGGTCAIVLTFAPVSTGGHVATLTLSDDASNSPQVINIKGTANSAVSAGAAPNGSTSAIVSAGQTAQFQLQLTPGAGYSGTVSMTCSGAPLAAVCQVPPTVAIPNAAPASFTVSVSTSGASGGFLPPFLNMPSLPAPASPGDFLTPAGPRLLFLTLAIALLLLTLCKWDRMNRLQLARAVPCRCALIAAILLFSLAFASGCGTGTGMTTTPPPPVVTPPGTTTLTISMSAMSSTQQPLQLPPLQLTLTVK